MRFETVKTVLFHGLALIARGLNRGLCYECHVKINGIIHFLFV